MAKRLTSQGVLRRPYGWRPVAANRLPTNTRMPIKGRRATNRPVLGAFACRYRESHDLVPPDGDSRIARSAAVTGFPQT